MVFPPFSPCLVILDGRDGGVLVEHTVSERKSTSISCSEATTQNAYRNSNYLKSAKPSRVSPKSGFFSISLSTYFSLLYAPNKSGF